MNLLDFIRGMARSIPRNDRERDSAELTVVLNRENPPKILVTKEGGGVSIAVETAMDTKDET